MSGFGAFAMVIVAAIMLALLGLAVVSRSVPHDRLARHTDVAGYVYAVIGVIYAVILAQVVVAAWDEYRDARAVAADEANAVLNLARLAQVWPEADRLRVEDALPEPMTLTLLIGAVVTVAFSYLFAVEDGWLHGLMTAALATLVALLLLLEFQLETPYEGIAAVQPTAMELVRAEIADGLGAAGGQP